MTTIPRFPQPTDPQIVHYALENTLLTETEVAGLARGILGLPEPLPEPLPETLPLPPAPGKPSIVVPVEELRIIHAMAGRTPTQGPQFVEYSAWRVIKDLLPR